MKYDIGMRLRMLMFAILLAMSSLTFPFVVQAAAIPFFGPIIPDAYDVCPASWGMLLIVVNNIIALLITLAIVFVAPLMIAWAGFLLVVNPANPGGKEQAKTILLNTVIGIVIALSGWLIVNMIMAALFNPKAMRDMEWSEIISSRGIDPCIDQAGALKTTPAGTPIRGIGATGTLNLPPAGALNFPQADRTARACNPAFVQAGARAGGFELTPTEANILACLAGPESSCGTNLRNFRWNAGVPGNPGSTAFGAFQVLLQTNSACYENSACYRAVGMTSGRLNCHAGFSNGNPRTDSTGAAIAQRCVNAASNLECSASAAACLLRQNRGSFRPWLADRRNSGQAACINTGGRTTPRI